jgi:hypothetical protein
MSNAEITAEIENEQRFVATLFGAWAHAAKF